MVEFTLEELLVAERPLSNLAQAKLSVGLAFQLGKMIKVVGEELRDIRQSQFTIAEKYGKRSEDGELVEENGMYPILPEHMAKFNEEMEELLKQTVSLNITPVAIAAIDGQIDLSVSDLMALEKFFTE